MMLVQPVILVLSGVGSDSGAGFGLLPLGLALFALLSLPAIAGAAIGARIRRTRESP